MPRTTPSCAEQGTARASKKVVMSRSRGLERMRVVSVAMVTQPKPSTMGKHGAAIEADDGEQPVGNDRQARQIAGILKHAEGEKEGGNDRQDQRQSVDHAHGPQAVVTHQHEMPTNS